MPNNSPTYFILCQIPTVGPSCNMGIYSGFDIAYSYKQTIDQRAKDLDLSFKPVKCVSHLFDGRHHMQQGIQLSGGSTRLITGGGTMFLGKSLEVSLSATKKAASKKMCDVLSRLLSTTDLLPIRGEYKLWLYRNYIVSLLRFHLSVDSVTTGAITKMENIATRHLKKWLNLPRSATRAVIQGCAVQASLRFLNRQN